MKNNNFLFAILLLIPAIGSSQFYAKAYSGYVFSSSPTKLQSVEIVDNVENIYVSKYKMGQGINAGLSLGYKCSKNFSFEITANTQIFPSKNIHIPQKDISGSMNFSISGRFGDTRYANSILQVAPQIIYTVAYNKKLQCYIKAGPDVLKVKTKFQNNSIRLDLDSSGFHPHQIETADIEKGDINIGIQSSAGVEYMLSKNIYCLVEFISVINQFKYKTDEATEYNIDGINHLDDINPRRQKITNRSKTNFSQVGFNIGIKYLL